MNETVLRTPGQRNSRTADSTDSKERSFETSELGAKPRDPEGQPGTHNESRERSTFIHIRRAPLNNIDVFFREVFIL